MTATAAQPLLSVRNVSKSFMALKALDDVSFEVPRGAIIGLIGPNGSGKSTLFNCVSGFMPFDTGTIMLNGRDISGLPSHAIARMGLTRTFQTTRLPGRMTALETLLAAAPTEEWQGSWSALTRRRAIREREARFLVRALELLSLVGIPHVANDYAAQLSGGQQRLLSIACVLFRDPDIILLDEPAAGVNPTLVRQLMGLIRSLRDTQGKTVLIVEHDMNFISKICDRVVVLDAGRKIAEGPPELIREDPQVLEVYLGGRRS